MSDRALSPGMPLFELSERLRSGTHHEQDQAARLFLNVLNIPVRHFIIPQPDGRTPYLERFILSEEPDGSRTYLHVIYSSDGDRDPHDHPFDFESTIVWGSYRETTYALGCISPAHVEAVPVAGKWLCPSCGMEATKPWPKQPVTFSKGEVNSKRAHELHKLEIVQGPVVTLVRRGPKIRSWGFQTDEGWIHHAPYIAEKFPGAQPTEVD